MATSISGGATLRSDGKTWQDAEGRPLDKEQIKAAEALHAEHAADNEAAEQALQELDARRRNVIVVREPAAAPKAKEK